MVEKYSSFLHYSPCVSIRLFSRLPHVGGLMLLNWRCPCGRINMFLSQSLCFWLFAIFLRALTPLGRADPWISKDLYCIKPSQMKFTWCSDSAYLWRLSSNTHVILSPHLWISRLILAGCVNTHFFRVVSHHPISGECLCKSIFLWDRDTLSFDLQDLPV